MGSGKRASMREGPLASLFRKTEDQGTEAREVADEAAPAARAPEPPAPAEAAEPAPPEPPAAEEGHVPHPSLSRDVPAPPPETRAPVPSPQQRLRAAFSSELPDDILEPPRREPAPQSHSREEAAPPAFAPVGGPGQPIIRVVGVGGAGVNALDRMIEAEVEGVEFVAINTDLQSLQQSDAHRTLHIGDELTRGLGAGADPDVGRAAAMEDFDRVKALLKGSDMVFVTAGAGGGTGTGAAPIVARIAKEVGALTVGIITKPFAFEGSRRREQADKGVDALAVEVDTLIVVPNNRLLSVLDRKVSMVEAFRVADDVLRQGVQGISDLVTLPGLINLDFADVRTIMSEAGSALLGIGMGSGERRASDAAEAAVASPLLETSMEGARKILLSITAPRDLSLWEVNEAARAVAEAAHPEANIIFGAMVDEKLDDQVWVTVVATGYGGETPRRERPRITEEPARRPPPAFREPAGEPRVRRASPSELEVPEFLPRG